MGNRVIHINAWLRMATHGGDIHIGTYPLRREGTDSQHIISRLLPGVLIARVRKDSVHGGVSFDDCRVRRCRERALSIRNLVVKRYKVVFISTDIILLVCHGIIYLESDKLQEGVVHVFVYKGDKISGN